MGKMVGVIIAATLVVTGFAPAAAATGRPEVQPATVNVAAKVQLFVKAIQATGSGYALYPPQDIAGMAPELCDHYAAGFTTDDLREVSGEKLAQAGEIALKTVC